MDTKLIMWMDKRDKKKIAVAAKKEGLLMSSYIRSAVLRKVNKDKSFWNKKEIK